MANMPMSRNSRSGGHFPVLDRFGVVAPSILAELRYNLTSAETFPDEEGTETARRVPRATTTATAETFPDEEGTETRNRASSAVEVQSRRDLPRRRGD